MELNVSIPGEDDFIWEDSDIDYRVENGTLLNIVTYQEPERILLEDPFYDAVAVWTSATPLKMEFFNMGGGVKMKGENIGTDAAVYSYYCAVTDHLGSTRAVVDQNGTLQEAIGYTPYGIMKQVGGVTAEDPVREKFTGKEFDEEGNVEGVTDGIEAYHFGARMFDPEVGVWMSPDVACQFWNSYGYPKNPVSFVDPDGNFALLATIGATLFTTATATAAAGIGTAAVLAPWGSNTMYEAQKMVSPVAFKLDYGIGTEMSHIGFDASIGVTPHYRAHAGASYYGSFYDNSYSGWAGRYGGEWRLNTPLGVASFSGTNFSSGEISQVTHKLSLGVPGTNISYENDGIEAMPNPAIGNALAKLPGVPTSDGDRYRTAAVRAEGIIPGINFGFNLFTGDPGALKEEERERELRADGYEYYTGGTADKYRAGALWVGAGPFRMGLNSEGVRHQLQNKLVHDTRKPTPFPRYTVLNRNPEFFFYFGTGIGNSLW